MRSRFSLPAFCCAALLPRGEKEMFRQLWLEIHELADKQEKDAGERQRPLMAPGKFAFNQVHARTFSK
jgi:hypothetical protein